MIRATSRSKHAYVQTSRREVAAAAHWLLNEFDAADFASLCLITDTPEERAELAANAQKLGKLFLKMGRRQGDAFEARIPRGLASWFGDLGLGMRTPSGRRGVWLRLSSACSAATRRHAGTKRLDTALALTRAQRGSDNERHKRRLNATMRRDRKFDELMERLGGSIIGGAF